MKSAFDLAAKRHEAIIKEAIWGAIAKGALSLGKGVLKTTAKAGTKLTRTVVQNPGKSIALGFGASEAQRGAQMLTKNI